MKMTIRELNSQIQVSVIEQRAEDKHRQREYKRKRLSQRVAGLIPLGTILAWIVAYGLSAPHTASLFIRITPAVFDSFNFAVFAPIVVEGFIAIVSALRAYGVQGYRGALYALMALSISVNVVGGLIALDNAPLSASVFEHGWIVISIFAGVVVSFLSLITGSIVVQFARGEINLEIMYSDSWRGLVRYNALYQALYDEAIKLGGTPSQAESVARNNARRLCNDVALDDNGMPYELQAQDDYTSAYSQAHVSQYGMTGATAHHATETTMTRHGTDGTSGTDGTMGFHQYMKTNHNEPLNTVVGENASHDKDTGTGLSQVWHKNQQAYAKAKSKRAWLVQRIRNDESLQGVTGDEVCYALFGTSEGYRRTVYRALKELE